LKEKLLLFWLQVQGDSSSICGPPSSRPFPRRFFFPHAGGRVCLGVEQGGCTGFIEPAAVPGGCTGVFQTHFQGVFDPKRNQKGGFYVSTKKFCSFSTTKFYNRIFLQPASSRTCFSGVWPSFLCVFPHLAGDWVAVGWGRIFT
jgi:hypothetical protein